MKRIGILSDTHGYLNPTLFDFFKDVDEIWHAGDWGNFNLVKQLEAFKPLRGVYGNIDGQDIRAVCPDINYFQVEDLKVMMLHIGGYPGRYSPGFRKIMKNQKIDLMVCGHSHILRIMRDPINKWMYINPGACGQHGFQKVNTAVRFKIEGTKMSEMEVWEQKRD